MTPEKIVESLKYLSEEAFDWRIGDEVLGIPWTEFVRIMNSAAEYIEKREAP